jgi:hypothetical protein
MKSLGFRRVVIADRRIKEPPVLRNAAGVG